jgi:D-methionine transport system substrate-binding protein
MSKKTWLIALGALLAIGSGVTYAVTKQQTADTIVVGSVTSDADIWRYIADSDVAQQAGLTIEVKEFSDGVALNTATAEGQVDVNAFQSVGYFNAFNQENDDTPLVNIGLTYLEPMGLYSEQYEALSDVPDGATVAVPNDQANLARGLRLLADAQLLTLTDDFDALSGTEKIQDNPKNLKIQAIDGATGPRVLKDGKVALVAISNSNAQAAGLHVLTDALHYEQINQSTKANVNLLATAQKNADDAQLKKLVTLYHDERIQAYINKTYEGTKVPVDKPVSYVAGEE